MSKKPSIAQMPKAAITFAKEARDELKKVSWPSRETTIRYTAIVIVSSIAVGLVTGGIDYIFALAIESII